MIINIARNGFLKCISLFKTCEKNCSTWSKLRWYKNVRRRVHTSAGPWNILFFGSDNFALESLKGLHERSQALSRLEVVTSCKSRKNVIAQYAKENGINIHPWPLLEIPTDFHIGIVVSFGHLIPVDIIQSFPLGMVNAHASLLPKWRGAAPIIYSLMNGDSQTGITLMKIKPKKFDIGEILTQVTTDIHPHETLPELYSRLAKLAADVLINNLEQLPELMLHAKPQNTKDVTYAPKVTSELSHINWDTMTAKDIYNLYRALKGLYPLVAKFETVNIKLLDIEEYQGAIESYQYNDPVGFMNFNKKETVLIVKCKQHTWISVKRVIVSGRGVMTANDFNNGYISSRRKRGVILK